MEYTESSLFEKLKGIAVNHTGTGEQSEVLLAPLPWKSNVSDCDWLQQVQQSISWYCVAGSYLQELEQQLVQMLQLAKEAGSATNGAVESLDEEFQRAKQQIARLIDGESGRFPAGATLYGRPLFLGDSPDGALRISLYTGYGRRGFGGLPLIRESDAPARASVIEGQLLRIEGDLLYLDSAAVRKEGVYVGSPIRIQAGRSVHVSVVLDYTGANRCVRLAEPLKERISTCAASYRIESRLSNCYIVGREDQEEAPVAEAVWGRRVDHSEGDYLFDCESGHIRTTPQAKAMERRLGKARAQITCYALRAARCVEELRSNAQVQEWLKRWEVLSRFGNSWNLGEGNFLLHAHGSLGGLAKDLYHN